MITRKHIRLVLALTVYAIFSFLIYFYVPNKQAHLEIDSPGYDRIAINFAQNNTLIDPYNRQSAPIQPVGYSFVIGCIYKLFGHSYTPVIAAQIILGLLSCLLIFLIALQIFDIRVANIAVFFAAINVGFLTYPQFLLAETLLLFLLLLFWWLYFERKYFLSGMMIGFSILVKSSALLFIPVAALFLFFLERKAPTSLKATKGAINSIKVTSLFLCGAYGPVLLYMTYNYYMWGYFAIAPLTSLNIYHVFFSKVLAQLHGGTPQQYMQTVLKFTGAHSFDESGWSNAKKLFFEYMSKEPVTFLYVWFKNVCKSTFGLFSTQLKVLLEPALKGGDCSFFKTSGTFLRRIITYARCGTDSVVLQLVALWGALWSLLRILPVISSFIVLTAKKQYGVGALIFLFIIQCLLITGFDGCARYRLICEPFIIIFAAAGFWHIYILCRTWYEERICSIKKR